MNLALLATEDLETAVNQLSMTTVGIGSVLLVLLVIASIILIKRRPKANKIKTALFGSILTVVVITTLVISGGTVYLNVQSYAGGPVHWHADIEVWACGNELNLRDPHGFLSNKIGTATLHEHNDKRIHLEGVPLTPKDASLGKFMQVVGGEITDDTFVFPLNDTKEKYFEAKEDGDGNAAPAPELIEPFVQTNKDGRIASFINGQKCGSQPAEVQVFAYQFNKEAKTYKQTKLAVPQQFAIADHGDVPPGDCVIFEFAPPKERTDKLCRQYGIRDIDKCERFGVKPEERSICENKEVQ